MQFLTKSVGELDLKVLYKSFSPSESIGNLFEQQIAAYAEKHITNERDKLGFDIIVNIFRRLLEGYYGTTDLNKVNFRQSFSAPNS